MKSTGVESVPLKELPHTKNKKEKKKKKLRFSHSDVCDMSAVKKMNRKQAQNCLNNCQALASYAFALLL